MDWQAKEIRTAAKAFADQLRTVDDTTVMVPGMDWDVAGLAAHLLSLPKLYRDQNEAGTTFAPPSDWAQFSISVREHITETNATNLAEQLVRGADEFLQEIGDDGSKSRWMYNQPTTTAGVAASFLGELIFHGQDLARLTGARPIRLDRRSALAIVDQSMILAPAFVHPERAAKCDGSYHLRFRGGGDYTWIVANGQMTASRGKPPKPDCHMVADPIAFAKVSLGRMGTVRAGLLGKVMGYGRKPWKLIALGKVRVDGV